MTSENQRWIEVLSKLRDQRRPCVQVVVTEVRGSAPREAGARMIVSGGKLVWGTIGGGNLEHLAMEHAGRLEASGQEAGESVSFPLSEKAGQCCGGQVTLFFECFPWQRHRVVVFGAGHVAQALAGLQPWLGAEVLLVDNRDEESLEPQLPAQRPYDTLFIDSPEEEIDTIDADSLVVIMTQDHALDLEILVRALQRGTFPYVGLIGSTRKWERFQKRLAARGFTEEQIATVTCPIGAAHTSKEPRAIAVSTAAELLECMEEVSRSRSGAPS